jgi:hypothetical protein
MLFFKNSRHQESLEKGKVPKCSQGIGYYKQKYNEPAYICYEI